MAIQYKIPSQNLTYQVPEEGEVFRGATGGVFKRQGGTLYAYDPTGGELGFNTNNLTKYNVPDAIYGLQGLVGTPNYKQIDLTDPNFFKPQAFRTTNEILTQTNRADNPNSAVVTSNLRGVINQGVALPAGVQQAGIDPKTGLPINTLINPVDTRPFAQTDPNRVINQTTGQTAISAQSIANGIKGLQPPLGTGGASSPIITTDSFKGGTNIQLPTQTRTSTLADSTFAGAGATQKSIQDYINLLTPQDTTTSNNVKSLIASINTSMESLSGRGTTQLSEEEKQGVEAKKQILQNAQTELVQKLAEYKAIQAKYQTLNADIEGKPITMSSIIGGQAQVNRAMQAELNTKASEIAMIQANVAGAQGNLQLAQDAANRAVDLKYEDAQNYINIQLKQLDLLQGELSKEEERRSEAVKMYLSEQANILNAQQAMEKEKNSTLLGLMQKYNDAGIIMSDTIESANRKITQNSQIYRKSIEIGTGGMGTGGTEQLYSGLSNATATAVRSKVTNFANEPLIQNFATIQEGYNFATSLSDITKNPADDQALIYSLAKVLDPGSVVREGEYATAQKYAQSWIAAYGKDVTQAIAGTGFLSKTARKNIKATIEQKYQSSKRSYDNLYSQYSGGINNLTGRSNGDQFLTDYVTPPTTQAQAPQTQQTQASQVFDEIVSTPQSSSWIVNLWNKLF